MPLQFDMPQSSLSIIKVVGIGGGGCNAVNYMHEEGIAGVDFIIANTDAQSLELSPVANRIQLGPSLTSGNGAGAVPEVGKNATLESLEEIKNTLGAECKMAFITAGMGGGTGTGGAPIIAKMLREQDMLVVAIVTFPFSWEGPRRIRQAQAGIEELKKHVDSLIVISNDKLRETHGNLELQDAFAKADDILTTAAKGIAEIITKPGQINVDFEDVRTVMSNSGVAIMGSGIAQGEDRALQAVRAALSSPLLDNNNIEGATNILLNLTSGTNTVKMDEVSAITNYIRQAAGPETDIIWGACTDENKDDELSVTIVATGFSDTEGLNRIPMQEPKKNIIDLNASASEVEIQTKGHHIDPASFVKDEPQVEMALEDEVIVAVNKNVDFEISKVTITEPTKVHMAKAPKVKKADLGISDAEAQRLKQSMERRKKLQSLSQSFSSVSGLTEMEREPAYKRKKVELEDVPNPGDSEVSRYSLSAEDLEKKTAGISKRNPFIFDNVD